MPIFFPPPPPQWRRPSVAPVFSTQAGFASGPAAATLLATTSSTGSAATTLLASTTVSGGAALTLVGGQNKLSFVDETGTNPLPAGVQVFVYGNGVLISSAYTVAGGSAPFVLPANSTFVATFVGRQAPTLPVTFTTDALSRATITVNGYRSPSLSARGYNAELLNLVPVLWLNDTARAQGGNAYAVGMGYSGVLNWLDQEAQVLLAMQRLQSSTGSDLDSWAMDFFGGQFGRLTGQPDASWSAMIRAILTTPKGTVAGIQAIINVFWPYILLQLGLPNFAEDTGYGGEDTATGGEDVTQTYTAPSPNQAIGEDNFGGEDTTVGFEDAPSPGFLPPNPIVFDAQTNPTLASLISPAIVTTQFGVYLQYPSYSDSLIRPVLPQSTLLANLVNAWKAAGYTPIYAQNR
jgi:hypothetical protein